MTAQAAHIKYPSQQNRTRYYAFDYVRSAALLMVVIFHVVIGIHDSHIYMPSSLYIFNESLRTLRMPMFFFASGMLFHIAFEKKNNRFWNSLLVGLVVPYLFWSPVQWLGKALLSSYTTNKVDFADLFSILWKPIDHFWFLYCLILLRIAARFDNQRGKLLIVLFAISVAYMFLFRLNHVPTFWRATLISGTARGMIYFVAGLLLSRNKEVTLFRFSGRETALFATLGIMIFAILRFIEWQFLSERVPVLAAFFEIIAEPTVGIVTALVIANGLKAPSGIIGKLAMLVAEGSLVIYILHPMIAAMVRGVLVRAGLGYWYIIMIFGVFIALSVPLCLFIFARNRGLLSAFALGPNRYQRKSRVKNDTSQPRTT